MPRHYPALDVTWPLRPDDERIDVLLAEIDDESPLAITEIDNGLRIFFPSSVARGRAGVRLVAVAPELRCEPVDVPDEDWAARSQAMLGAIRVGQFVVAPPWATAALIGDVIVIQPSMGFGTAHHASTRLCLRLLSDLPVGDAAVLDVGTGSGILAIAAARLNAARVLAIDHDPDALTSARENVDLNHAGGRVVIEQVDLADDGPALELHRWAFDVVLANLTGATLVRFAHQLAGFLKPGGSIVTSGYGPDEARTVADAFAREGLVPGFRDEEDGWVGACFTRPSPTPHGS